MTSEECQICGEGELRRKVAKVWLYLFGKSHDIDVHFSVCDWCGSEQADAGQLRLNKQLMADAMCWTIDR